MSFRRHIAREKLRFQNSDLLTASPRFGEIRLIRGLLQGTVCRYHMTMTRVCLRFAVSLLLFFSAPSRKARKLPACCLILGFMVAISSTRRTLLVNYFAFVITKFTFTDIVAVFENFSTRHAICLREQLQFPAELNAS
jgi:hypothetical protein